MLLEDILYRGFMGVISLVLIAMVGKFMFEHQRETLEFIAMLIGFFLAVLAVGVVSSWAIETGIPRVKRWF